MMGDQRGPSEPNGAAPPWTEGAGSGHEEPAPPNPGGGTSTDPERAQETGEDSWGLFLSFPSGRDFGRPLSSAGTLATVELLSGDFGDSKNEFLFTLFSRSQITITVGTCRHLPPISPIHARARARLRVNTIPVSFGPDQ